MDGWMDGWKDARGVGCDVRDRSIDRSIECIPDGWVWCWLDRLAWVGAGRRCAYLIDEGGGDVGP